MDVDTFDGLCLEIASELRDQTAALAYATAERIEAVLEAHGLPLLVPIEGANGMRDSHAALLMGARVDDLIISHFCCQRLFHAAFKHSADDNMGALVAGDGMEEK